jgi:hypothetical protein
VTVGVPTVPLAPSIAILRPCLLDMMGKCCFCDKIELMMFEKLKMQKSMTEKLLLYLSTLIEYTLLIHEAWLKSVYFSDNTVGYTFVIRPRALSDLLLIDHTSMVRSFPRAKL